MKAKYILTGATAAMLMMAACTDTSEISERIDNLESRVTALEAVIEGLNNNVVALQAIAEGNTISDVQEAGGIYTITLANGDKIVLNQGSVGMGKAPLLSLDAQGNWMVDYQDGAGAQYLLQNDKMVRGLGIDGVTPKFGVDASGYWTVDYSDGRGAVRVLDANGSPVKAVADNVTEDSYFANVEITGETLVLTLKNGQKYNVPIVGGFLFRIIADEGDQTFKWGETKSFSVESKGVADATVVAPPMWNATLSALGILSVTAPKESDFTKASIADSRKDVSVIAFSSNGFSTVSKVRVYLEGMVYAGEVAAAGIVCGATTASTITFRVILENASSWKYIFQEASALSPSAEDVLAYGTDGTSTELVFGDLLAETKYSLFVVPSNAEGVGGMARLTVSTTAFSNLYEAYQAGNTINVGGLSVNKTAYGDGHLLSASEPNVLPGVNFVPAGVAAVQEAAVGTACFVIGNEPGVRSKLSIGGAFTPAVGGVVAYKNVEIAWTDGFTGYAFYMPSGDLDALVIDGCLVNHTRLFVNRAISGVKNLVMVDSDYHVVTAPYSVHRSWTINTPVNFQGESIVLRNNIIYNDAPEAFYVIGWDSGNYKENNPSASYKTVVFDHNTFYNVTNQGMIQVGNITESITIKGNLSWAQTGSIVYVRTLGGDPTERTVAEGNKGAGWFLRVAKAPNYIYSEDNTDTNIGSGQWYNMGESFPFVDSKPHVTGNFTVDPSFAGFGASR
ncbi:MAG: hypothetical protein IJQ93_10985 [Bacteroidales bacterium]|nr:hypothetical protein [Bacteroidales bacterium]